VILNWVVMIGTKELWTGLLENLNHQLE